MASEAAAMAKSGLDALNAYAKSGQAQKGVTPDLSEKLKDLQKDPDNLNFAQFARFEMELLAALPLQMLQRRAWEIRERFHVLFGDDRYRNYIDSKPPDPAGNERDALVADLQMLMECISKAYILALGRERQIRRLKGIVFLWSGAAWTAALITWAFLERDNSPYHMIPLLALFGLFGATVSIFRRVQGLAVINASATDPALELMSLRLGGIGVIVALLSGWVFAMLVGFILQAGFISLGDLVPKFEKYGVLEPVEAVDSAKLLVFAFVAGFAERFVPDVIDRLTQKAAAAK